MNGFANVIMAVALSAFWAGSVLAQTEHFHPKGKPPSEHTLQVLKESSQGLPFSDTRDFEEELRGE